LRGTMLLESPLLNYHVTQGGSFFEMPNGPSTVELDRLARERSLPYWSAEFRFWGPPKVIDAQWEYVKEKFGAIPGSTFVDGRRYVFPADVDQNDPTLTVALGIPSLGVFGLLQGGGHLGFSPIIPMTGEAIFKAQRAFGRLYAELALPAANQFAALPWSYNPRALVLLFGLPMSRDKEQNRQSREIFERLVEVSAANGWAEYRTHIAFMDKVAEMYTFNDHAMRRFHELAQGRRRSERDPLARQVRHLAETVAQQPLTSRGAIFETSRSALWGASCPRQGNLPTHSL